MGVDVNAVAGYTVPLTKEIIDRTLETRNTDDVEDIYDEFGIDHDTIGSSYLGDTKEIPLIAPSPKTFNKEIKDFLKAVNKAFYTQFTIDDVRWVSGTHWW